MAFVLQVECKPVFAEQKAQINTSQLNNVCHGMPSWYSAAATGGQAPGTVTGESFGQADMVEPTYKTLTTNFRVL